MIELQPDEVVHKQEDPALHAFAYSFLSLLLSHIYKMLVRPPPPHWHPHPDFQRKCQHLCKKI